MEDNIKSITKTPSGCDFNYIGNNTSYSSASGSQGQYNYTNHQGFEEIKLNEKKHNTEK